MKTKLEMELEITQEIVDAIAEKMIASGDYVPVVRCKDCKHWGSVLYPDTQFAYGECDLHFITDVNPEMFCAWGERKDDAGGEE